MFANRASSYNKYSHFLKSRYQGKRVYKVIVDAGFTCPNRDGTKGFGGCTYCNVDSFTPQLPRQLSQISDQIVHGIARARQNYQAEKFIIYFQPNSNTYAPLPALKQLYDTALSVNTEDIVGLSVGTRPDCLDEEKINLLESYTDHYDVDIEMGMESIYDDTLRKINRGCTHADLEMALALLKDKKVSTCVHTIFGFPWETKAMMLAYAGEINRFSQVKFVKLHHLHIVKGSIMGSLYAKNPFELFSLEGYANFLCEFLPLLRPDIVVQRLFGIADYAYLLAPNWGINKSSIQTYIDKALAERSVVQGSAFNPHHAPISR